MFDVNNAVEYEVAISTLSSMIGLCSMEIMQEKAKICPDLNSLAKLEGQHSKLWLERHDLRYDDGSAIERVLNRYGVIVRQR